MTRIAGIEERLSRQFRTQTTCSVIGCTRPTQRSAGNGLSNLHCKAHVEFHRRHGSHWQRSYRASELAPYRKAARRWLKEHRADRSVAGVSAALERMLASSGRPESAYDLRGMPPKEKARIALARLHAASIPGEQLIEITLAVSARVVQFGPAGVEFLYVQIAKAVHRLASGTHRTTSGIPIKSKYAPSSGRLLRILGRRIHNLAGIVADSATVAEIIRMAQPEVTKMEASEAKRRWAEEMVARETERVSGFGMGPERLARYRKQLRRQYGLK